MRNDETERWVDAWQAGNNREESFRRLFEECSPGVLGFFRRRGFSPDHCEDLLQETFLGVYQSLPRFRREVSFHAWLFALAANTCRKALRRGSAGKRRGRQVSLEEAAFASDRRENGGGPLRADTPPTALRSVLAKEDLRRVSRCLDSLPEKMRCCVVLSLGHGWSAGRIAHVLRLSPSTVKVQLFRARRRLRTPVLGLTRASAGSRLGSATGPARKENRSMTVKEQVLEVVSRMPNDSTLDDIGYEIYVIQSVREGLAELDRGNYLTHDEAGDELGKWLKK